MTTDLQQGNALSLVLNARKKNEAVRFISSYEGSKVEFLGLEILTGRVTRSVTAKPKPSVSKLKKMISTIKPDQQVTIQFTDVEVIEVYSDWYIREAERLSQLLIEKFEAEAVYLFGSLVWSDIHAPETDIDLAVSGLSPERYLEAVSYLERESNFPVDLVELEKVSDHLRQRILAEGKLLSERELAIAPG